MPKDYIIAVGGTGARCLESVVYMAAAGLFTKPLHVLMIDPDQTNGNSVRTKKVLPLYHAIYGCEQPRNVQQRTLLSRGKQLSEPAMFRAAINLDTHAPGNQYPFFWIDPNRNDREFKEAIDYNSLSRDFQNFIGLFYDDEDLEMNLGKGYRGRPNIGAVTLTADLKRTIKKRGNGLFELFDSIRADIKSDTARVFVLGSVFGGTGAAGIPTVPELLRGEFEEGGKISKLRLGCAMMTPYFTFEVATVPSKEGPAPDSDIHQVATQAALLHYSNVPPGYQHAYVIGAPELLDSRAGHQAGGEEQENDSHYAEIVAALAARDFFLMQDVDVNDRQLHYTESTEVSWASLPASLNENEDSRDIKRKLVAFTTLAYAYKNILHDDLKDSRWRSQQAWYKDNFTKQKFDLDNQGQTLDTLNSFLSGYLQWLSMVGQSSGAEERPLFNWGALTLGGKDAERELGRLTSQESEESPRYVNKAYGKLMEKLNYLQPSYSNKVHPVGLLIYLLYEASLEFCVENYYLK
jgi:hypothetical protein